MLDTLREIIGCLPQFKAKSLSTVLFCFMPNYNFWNIWKKGKTGKETLQSLEHDVPKNCNTVVSYWMGSAKYCIIGKNLEKRLVIYLRNFHGTVKHSCEIHIPFQKCFMTMIVMIPMTSTLSSPLTSECTDRRENSSKVHPAPSHRFAVVGLSPTSAHPFHLSSYIFHPMIVLCFR